MKPGIRSARTGSRAGYVTVMACAVILAVAACGSTNPESANPSTGPTATSPTASASPTASPSPSLTPSPSPSSDVGSAFVAKLSAFQFSAHSTISGEYDLATARYAVDGSFDVSGLSQHRVVTIHSPGGQAAETIYAEGVNYSRTGSGPWYVKPPTLHDTDLTAFFRTLKSATDTGVETKNGASLHHLTLAAAPVLPPTAFGLTEPTINGTSGTVEFWAADDGSPSVMDVHETWTQKASAGTVDVTFAIELTFTGVGTVFSIDAPTDVWTTYASPISHLTFAYPADWDLFKNRHVKKVHYDQVAGPADAYADIYREASQGVTANELVAYIKTNPDHVKGFHVDSVKTVKFVGVSGRQMRIHATILGTKRYWIYTFAVKGAYFYEIDLFDTKGHEPADLTLANEFAASIVVR